MVENEHKLSMLLLRCLAHILNRKGCRLSLPVFGIYPNIFYPLKMLAKRYIIKHYYGNIYSLRITSDLNNLTNQEA